MSLTEVQCKSFDPRFQMFSDLLKTLCVSCLCIENTICMSYRCMLTFLIPDGVCLFPGSLANDSQADVNQATGNLTIFLLLSLSLSLSLSVNFK